MVKNKYLDIRPWLWDDKRQCYSNNFYEYARITYALGILLEGAEEDHEIRTRLKRLRDSLWGIVAEKRYPKNSPILGQIVLNMRRQILTCVIR